jgi:hypothetical protein
MYPEQETKQLDSIVDDRLDSKWEPIRRAMGHARTLAGRIDLVAMVPRNDLASCEYCLANPGREYLVYLPDGGSVSIDLSAVADRLSVTWLNPSTGKATRAGTASGGTGRKFKSPFRGDALLYIFAAHLADL